MNTMTKYISAIMLMIGSTTSHAMTVWLVESGANPFSNPQETLALNVGLNSLDLYYDVAGDTSYGYDFMLDITGVGSITAVGGGDSGLGNNFGTGWRQFGGDPIGEIGNSVLGFSFDFTAEAATSLLISGTYTDAYFADAAITSSTLATTITAVPVPAALWLMLSGLGLIGFTAKNKK